MIRTEAATNDESPDWITKVAAAMAAVVTLLTPVLSVLASAGGGFERLLRNEGPLAISASALIGFGFVLVLLAFFVLTGTSRKRKAYATRAFAVASIAIVLGIGGILWAASRAATLREEPSIVASVKREPALHVEGSIRASGLAANDRMNVLVRATTADGASEQLFTSVTGPDAAGLISIPIDVPLLPEIYDHVQIEVWSAGSDEPKCDEASRGQVPGAACANLKLPRMPVEGS